MDTYFDETPRALGQRVEACHSMALALSNWWIDAGPKVWTSRVLMTFEVELFVLRNILRHVPVDVEAHVHAIIVQARRVENSRPGIGGIRIRRGMNDEVREVYTRTKRDLTRQWLEIYNDVERAANRFQN